ncbi:6,7-dimethyl-8-ribityllumazine synthase [subsurface metagenome]|jgi:6,7-dimethyl-8-ribityllumazine synthase|nr:6,7-dimethyl-8-ribityllumazine synthase [Clostridia bacterium]TET15336.1 MAG: 6,7-dimethyl-8-ribityllumazine synthase [Actinomycetota bacterium]
MKKYEGKLDAKKLKIGIVVSRYNDFITSKLLDGALDCLHRHQCEDGNINIAWVPGAFEIPSAVKIMAESKKYNAIVCLGAVIKGDSSHNQYIASETIKGVAKISLDFNIPVSFGVITPDSLEQAIERAGTKRGNKGWGAALSAIEMANLFIELKS